MSLFHFCIHHVYFKQLSVYRSASLKQATLTSALWVSLEKNLDKSLSQSNKQTLRPFNLLTHSLALALSAIFILILLPGPADDTHTHMLLSPEGNAKTSLFHLECAWLPLAVTVWAMTLTTAQKHINL